jgi:hypothetical protein
VQDVQRAYAVGVLDQTAFNALELRLGDAVLICDVPASAYLGRARAGGVAGIHRDHAASGTLSLLRQDSEEQSPTRIQDALVQPGLGRGTVREERAVPVRVGLGCGRFRHARCVQDLVPDHVVLAHERKGRLVVVVEPLAPDLGVQPGDLPCCGTVLLRPLFRLLGEGVEDALSLGELVGHRCQEARVLLVYAA